MNPNIDPTINPKDDFYGYACGGWMKQHPLPPEKARFGTFDLLRENNREQLKTLITELDNDERSKQPDTIQQKINDLYRMGMDKERLNREGATPLMPQLKRISETTKANFYDTVAWMHNGIGSVFFSTGVGIDPKDSNRHIMYIGETGLGLGDRDYYLVDEEDNRRIMDAYRTYLRKLMLLIGKEEAEAERICNNVIEMETELAKVKMSREERRDPLVRFNMRTKEQIISDYSEIPWVEYFNKLSVEMPSEANITNPKYMQRVCELLQSWTLQQMLDYMTVSAVSSATGLLSDDFGETSFELYGRVMSGTEEREPRWKRAMSIPTSMFAEAVGEIYIDRYFSADSKQRMLTLVGNLRKALHKHISELVWMSDATKHKALDKLAKMTVKIGYPDKWKDYTELHVNPSLSYLENVYNASVWYTQDNYQKLHKPVDKDEWYMSPQTVNAYYSPATNEICFPAGILQPPFFNPDASDAINYGAIGVVIGHEMTHGFDDQGRHFDADGNLQDWWTPEDEEKFKALTNRLVKQFNDIEVAPGLHANGEFTLGENIADQGGLRLALTALSMNNDFDFDNDNDNDNDNDLSKNGVTVPRASGARSQLKNSKTQKLNDLKAFYLSYAGVWANNIRPEEIASATKTDPHSLGKWRVNATLRNIEPFFRAFDIHEGDAMYLSPSDRTIIW